MREVTNSEKCLDDVMRVLWQRWLTSAEGVEVDSIQNLVCHISGVDLNDFMHSLIYQTDELPLPDLLKNVGIELKSRVMASQKDRGGKSVEAPLPAVSLGAFFKEQDGALRILRLDEDGSAMNAGLSAEDSIIAVDGIRLSLDKLEQKLALANVGDSWQVHAFRRDELYEFTVTLLAAKANTVELQCLADQGDRQQSWLGAQH